MSFCGGWIVILLDIYFSITMLAEYLSMQYVAICDILDPGKSEYKVRMARLGSNMVLVKVPALQLLVI
jgi:hypothetical protein